MLNADILSWIRFGIATALLVVASYQDVKSREIDDRVWWALVAVCWPLAVAQLVVTAGLRLCPLTMLYIVSAVVGIALGLVLGLCGLTGGADAKAIIALSLIEVPRLGRGIFSIMPSIAILTNSVIMSLLYPLGVLALNIADTARGERLFTDIEATPLEKAIALISLRRLKVRYVKNRMYKYSVAEKIVDGRRRLVLSLRVPGDVEKIPPGYGDDDYIWVAPLMPMVVFIALGYIVYSAYGCVLDMLLAALVGKP